MPRSLERSRLVVLGLAAAACLVAASGPRAAAPAGAGAPLIAGCLPGGDGYLRARIRGALNLDIDWHDAQLECEGGLRPGGSGIRLSFAGTVQQGNRHLRLLFGIRAPGPHRTGRELPTNLTVILEGERRLFATRGEDKCTLDSMRQERISAPRLAPTTYRVVARGFCTGPATTLSGSERIVVSRFDFAGRLREGDDTSSGSAPRPDASAGRGGI